MKGGLVTHHDAAGHVELSGQSDVSVAASASFRNVDRIHRRSAHSRRLDLVLTMAGRAHRGGNNPSGNCLPMNTSLILLVDLVVTVATNGWDRLVERLGAGSLHLMDVTVATCAVGRSLVAGDASETVYA